MSKRDIDWESVTRNMALLISGMPYKYHLKIHSIYNLTVPRGWHIEKNRRNKDQHIIFVKQGRGFYYLDGSEELLIRGKIIFVSNNFPHSAIQDLNDPPSIIPVRFGIYDNTNLSPVDLFSKAFCFSLIPEDIIYFERKFEELYRYYSASIELGCQQACNAVLSQLLIDINHYIALKRNVPVDNRAAYAKELIDKNISHNISVHDIAEKVGISQKHLSRLFKKFYGITPKQYQITSCIRYARFLLEETGMTISDIAYYLHYPDAYSFSKQFKKVTGFWPSQLRNCSKEYSNN